MTDEEQKRMVERNEGEPRDWHVLHVSYYLSSDMPEEENKRIRETIYQVCAEDVDMGNMWTAFHWTRERTGVPTGDYFPGVPEFDGASTPAE